MAQIDNRYALGGTAARTGVAVDEGLRAYMLRVYNYMAAGIALTGVVAYLIFTYSVTSDPALAANAGGRIMALHRGMYLTPLGQTLFTTPLMYVLIFAPLAFVFFLSWRISTMSVSAAQIAFWLFAAVMGASLSSIFLRYTATSITQVFFVTAAAFGALSLYGYTTKKDLSGWGSFLIMGVIGLIIASFSAMQFIFAPIWGRVSDRVVARGPASYPRAAHRARRVRGRSRPQSWMAFRCPDRSARERNPRRRRSVPRGPMAGCGGCAFPAVRASLFRAPRRTGRRLPAGHHAP